jgi:tetratricopeptide (TPR) repeat protein
LLTAIFFGCNPQPEASELLTQAEKFADQEQADSALMLIDSIFYPEKSFGEEEYMQYLVTRVRVRYKAYRDITGDTAIFDAWKYYKQKATVSRRTALAAFYSGCVYREQGELNMAMHAYVEAMSEAKKTADSNLKGLVQNNIGDLLSEQGLDNQALEAYRKAESYYRKYPAQQIVSIANIGRCYMLLGKTDSAISVFNKGLLLAHRSADRNGESLLAQNLSVAYSQQGKYGKALPILQRAFRYNSDSTLVPRFYLNFANLYARLSQPDSSEYYYGLVKSKVDSLDVSSLQISIYYSLAETEEEKGDYRQAIKYLKKDIVAFEKLMQSSSDNSVLDIQQKYNFELLKNAHQEDVSRYQYGLIILLIVIIAGIIVFTRYNINQKNRLIETHEKIVTLSKMAFELEQSSATRMALQEQSMRDLLLWKFDVIKKSVLLTKIDSDNAPTSQLAKKFHQIVYQNTEHDPWADFENVINHISKNLSTRIRKHFPDLSEKEYRICLLTYAGMNVKEIAVILELSSNSIQAYRGSLRKKIGIDDAKTDTETYLKQVLDNN